MSMSVIKVLIKKIVVTFNKIYIILKYKNHLVLNFEAIENIESKVLMFFRACIMFLTQALKIYVSKSKSAIPVTLYIYIYIYMPL